MRDAALCEGWPKLAAAVSAAIDIDLSARVWGAFERPRGVPSAEALLRLALAWASGLSLRQVCALAAATGVAHLADASLVGRLGRADTVSWLAEIAGVLLAERLPAAEPRRRLVLVDGTAICHPGADRTSWRLHVAYDPVRRRLDAVELTDGRGAERLSRFTWRAGDVAVADRYYARPGELRALLDTGADLVVRIGWNAVRLLSATGEPFDLMAALDRTGAGPREHAVRVDDRSPDPPLLRLVVMPLPASEAEAARRRLARAAKKRGHTPDARSLKAAGFLMLLTSLPADDFAPERVCALYGLRWQVELVFKRLKSLLGLGLLPAKNPDLARVWLYGKLILALLAETEADLLRRALSPSAGPAALPVADLPCRAAQPHRRHPRAAARRTVASRRAAAR